VTGPCTDQAARDLLDDIGLAVPETGSTTGQSGGALTDEELLPT
jgi:hypothetical protein